MAGDLWALYRLTVDDLARSPAMHRVFAELYERIAVEPWSMARTEILGDDLFYGWTPEAAATAACVEETRAVAATIASLASKKKRRVEPYEGRPKPRRKQPKTLAEAFAQFQVMQAE